MKQQQHRYGCLTPVSHQLYITSILRFLFVLRVVLSRLDVVSIELCWKTDRFKGHNL